MMTPAVAALRIERQLKTVETRFDQLLSEHASLTALLAQARIESAEPFGNAQQVMLRMCKSHEAIVASRGDLVRVHGELERIAVERGDIMVYPKPSNSQLNADASEDQRSPVAA